MYRPKIDSINLNVLGPIGVEIWHDVPELRTEHEAAYIGFVQSAFAGNVGVTQLINGYASNLVSWIDTQGSNQLDAMEFNNGADSTGDGLYAVIGNEYLTSSFSFADFPHTGCSGNRPIMDWKFEDYIRFKPSSDGSIYVTLGIVDWHTYAESQLLFNSAAGINDYYPFNPPARGPAHPGDADYDGVNLDSSAFPEWKEIRVIHSR